MASNQRWPPPNSVLATVICPTAATGMSTHHGVCLASPVVVFPPRGPACVFIHLEVDQPAMSIFTPEGAHTEPGEVDETAFI